MKKNVFLFSFFLLLSVFGFLSIKSIFAEQKAGYLNISGVYIPNPPYCTASCRPKELNKECNPDSKTCDGGGKNWVYKYVCSGDAKPGGECGNGKGTIVDATKSKNSTSVDGACGQTIQLDVFDKECDATPGKWDCGLPSDYMVWYTGDCPAGGTGGNPTDTPVPGSNATNPPGATTAPGSPTNTPVPGSNPTSTPTPPLACGMDCTTNPSVCQKLSGCTACLPNPSNPSKSICSTPNTTPTSTPAPACGQTCSTDNDCVKISGCTACVSGTCQSPNGSPTPTPTSTAFNPAMCKCDGIQASAIIAGQDAKVSAFAKVTGSDTTKATITGMSFSLTAGTTGVVPATIVSANKLPGATADLVRYQSDWTVSIPGNLDTGVVYQINAVPQCVRQTSASAANYAPQTRVVLGAKTSNQSFVQKVVSFFSSLFGGSQTPTFGLFGSPSPTPTPSSKAIQVLSFKQAEVVEKSCTYFAFKFGEIGK